MGNPKRVWYINRAHRTMMIRSFWVMYYSQSSSTFTKGELVKTGWPKPWVLLSMVSLRGHASYVKPWYWWERWFLREVAPWTPASGARSGTGIQTVWNIRWSAFFSGFLKRAEQPGWGDTTLALTVQTVCPLCHVLLLTPQSSHAPSWLFTGRRIC